MDLPATNPPAIIYPVPAGETPSPDFTLQVEAAPVFVYQANVRTEILQKPGLWSHKPDAPSERASFAIFDMNAPVTVSVTPAKPFTTATVLPHRAGIACEVTKGVIRFRLAEPRHLTLLLDGCDANPLHLFIGRPPADLPLPSDPGVIYFGPGVHTITKLAVKSGQTVCLAGGALVKAGLEPGEKGEFNEKWQATFYHGSVLGVTGVKDVRICGRGILDGSLVPHPGRNLVRIGEASGIRLEGIMLRDAPNWNVIVDHSEDVVVDDVRIISGRLNSDGINSVNSKTVTVKNCFVRNHDDSIVVKTTRPGRPAEDIRVEDCQLWDDWGFAMGVTYETRSPVSRIRYRRCSVLYARHWCMGIRVCDSSLVSDVSFEDIEVADLSGVSALGGARNVLSKDAMLLWMGIVKDVWGQDPEPGLIRGVRVENVTVHSLKLPPSEMAGFNDTHPVENVTIRNVRLAGQPPVADAAALGLKTNAFVRNITIAP